MIYILYIVLGFLAIGILSILISYLTTKNINEKLRIQMASKEGIKTLFHENSSKNVDDVINDASEALQKLGIELSVENVLKKTYKSE